jgi:hypothetical protein
VRVPRALAVAGALEEATTALAGGLHAIAPTAAHVVVTCPDLSRAPGLGPVLRRVVGARCRAVASRQRRVLEEAGVVVIATDGPVDPAMLGDDGLHPGRSGVVALADRAAAALVGVPPSRSDGHGP